MAVASKVKLSTLGFQSLMNVIGTLYFQIKTFILLLWSPAIQAWDQTYPKNFYHQSSESATVSLR